jgi:hypothetical protein
MENNKNKLDSSEILASHRQKSDMTGGGTPSRLAANVTSHGIVCSALLGSVVFILGAVFFGLLGGLFGEWTIRLFGLR